jgi:septal ring factor EnvC (AmiA/AmiB activator)
MSFAEPPLNVVAKHLSQAQKLKSVRKQLYNQKVKSSKMVRQLAAEKDKLNVANDHISDLQHANKSLLLIEGVTTRNKSYCSVMQISRIFIH